MEEAQARALVGVGVVPVREGMLEDMKGFGDALRESHARPQRQLQGVEMLNREGLVVMTGEGNLRPGYPWWVRSLIGSGVHSNHYIIFLFLFTQRSLAYWNLRGGERKHIKLLGTLMYYV
jgi:hypothetical protein